MPFTLTGFIFKGRLPLLDSIPTPILDRGEIMRFIGLFVSDSSPINSALTRWPANNPANNRMVVPEFPQSRGSLGSENTPPIIQTLLPSLWLSIPHWARHFLVDSTSSPVDILWIIHSPSVREANIRDRCEMDLSPGRLISPLILISFNLLMNFTNSIYQIIYHFIGIGIIFLQITEKVPAIIASLFNDA